MKIVVLAGGTSTEREISIVSGTMVCKALRSKGHEAILADVFCGIGAEQVDEALFAAEDYDVDAAAAYMRSFDEHLETMIRERREFFGPHILELCQIADVVFLALHGANGEDGKVQAAFDLFGIPYTGTGYLSSAIAMDKSMTKQFFRAHQVPTPGGVTLSRTDEVRDPASLGLELPLVVKPCCGGSSVGVYIAHTMEEYDQALENAFAYEPQVIVEEYIQGREFSVGVVDGKAYPIIEIAPIEGFYDYVNKYKAGSTIETCPAELSGEQTRRMQEYAEAGAAALGIMNYCRLDFMMREDGRMYCLEANTLPGMTPTSLLPQEAKVLGMDYPELCEHLIELSMRKWKG
ncbi:MAG: D-alanine--D-alanine ligase [Fusicatenibacter sp.]|nr:D-alanine--D-alanine ligase [Fusicatenibacter sp.]MDY2937179.1 D-alanine--D-alanine ligase [Fusicatenibacter sp.]